MTLAFEIMLLAYIAPLFIAFDFFQLIAAERFIGLKQVRAGEHPLESGKNGPTWVAVLWLLGAFSLWVYMAALTFSPRGAMQGFIMLIASLLGFSLRRTLGLKFALVILTFEAAIRMGLLVNFMVSAFFWEGLPLPPSFYR